MQVSSFQNKAKQASFQFVSCAGFFENKEADAKARGQKLPKKPDPKQEYDNFLKSIADDVQEVEARQEVEAVEAAQDKADQEAFEHGWEWINRWHKLTVSECMRIVCVRRPSQAQLLLCCIDA